MDALVNVTDLVTNLQPLDLTGARLQPLQAGSILEFPVPPGTKPGDEIYIVVKGSVRVLLG